MYACGRANPLDPLDPNHWLRCPSRGYSWKIISGAKLCKQWIILVMFCTVIVARKSAAADEIDAHGVRSFVALGLGVVSIRHTPEGRNDSAVVTSLQLGQRLTTALQLVEDFQFEPGKVKLTDPLSQESNGVALLALRWRPLAARREQCQGLCVFRYVDVSALYLQLGAGIGVRDRVTYQPASVSSDAELGPTAGIAAIWLPAQGQDSALGIDTRLFATRFSNGTHYGAAVVVTANLYL